MISFLNRSVYVSEYLITESDSNVIYEYNSAQIKLKQIKLDQIKIRKFKII